MNRRAMSPMEMIGAAALMLLIVIVIATKVIDTNSGITLAGGCTAGGGTCRPGNACNEGEYHTFSNLLKPCSGGTICCVPIKDQTPVLNPDGTSSVPVPTLAPASIRATFLSGITASQNNAVYPSSGTSGNQQTQGGAGPFTFRVTAPFNLAPDCKPDGSPGDNRRNGSVCKGDWKIVVSVEDQNHNTIIPITPIVGTTAAGSQAPSLETKNYGISSPIQNNGVPVFSLAISNTALTQGLPLIYTFTIAPAFTSQLVGQKLHLVVRAYPGKNPGDMPSLEQNYDMYFTVTSPIKIGGLTQTWAQKKQATVGCISPIKCTEMYVYFAQASDPNFVGPPNPNTQDPSQCVPPSTIQSTVQSATAPTPLPSGVTKYCSYAKGKQIGCYDTMAQCSGTTGGADPTIAAALSALQTNGIGQNSPYLSSMNTYSVTQNNNQGSAPQCQQQLVSVNNCDTTSPDGCTGPTHIYRVTPFDPLTQSGMVPLDRQFMSGKNLCVYGKDASGNFYSAASGQKIMIDQIPPVANINFDPLKMLLTFSCKDTTGTVADAASSGCKPTFGVAYISDSAKFLPALTSGPQSASSYCPASGYSTETRSLVRYTDIAVRVLCMQVTDNAGNTAVTMATVFNGYDMLAKFLIAQQQK